MRVPGVAKVGCVMKRTCWRNVCWGRARRVADASRWSPRTNGSDDSTRIVQPTFEGPPVAPMIGSGREKQSRYSKWEHGTEI